MHFGLFWQLHQLLEDKLFANRLDLFARFRAIGDAEMGKKNAQIVISLSHSANGGTGIASMGFLLDGNRSKESINRFDFGLRHLLDVLASIGRHRFDIAALSFGIDCFKGKGGFSRAGGTRANGNFAMRNGNVKALEVVLLRFFNVDRFIEFLFSFFLFDRFDWLMMEDGMNGFARWRIFFCNRFRGACRNDFTAIIASFRTEVDDPIGNFHKIHIVLDDKDSVLFFNELLEHFDELVNVVKMQSRSWLIENIERLSSRWARKLFGQFDPLRFTTRKCRRTLSQLDVVQTHFSEH